jgi:NAD(P)H-flavin reductase
MLSTYQTILSQKTRLNDDTYLFNFELIEPKEIIFKAGQYLVLKINDQSRLYSIASPNINKNNFELIVQIIPGGLASNYLSGLKIKDKVNFQGPAGEFILKENNKSKIFLVTGTGIVPILSIIKSEFSITNYQFSVNLFWGLKTYRDIYLFDQLRELTLLKRIQLKICLSREANLNIVPEQDKKYFALGHIYDSFDQFIENFDFYLCGGRQVVESLRLFLLSKNIKQENIYFEKF